MRLQGVNNVLKVKEESRCNHAPHQILSETNVGIKIVQTLVINLLTSIDPS